MTFDEADALPLAIATPENAAFQKDDIIAQPRLPQIMKADQMVYFMLRDAFPDRGMFFSRTAGGYPYELGLERYVVTQGMVKKLMPKPVAPSDDIVLIPGEGAMDVTRSMALWKDVFTATKSLAARNGWVDDASVGIPDLYVISGITLAEALAQTGRTEESRTVYDQSKQIATAMRRAQIFGFDRQPTLPVAPGADTAAQPLLLPPSDSK